MLQAAPPAVPACVPSGAAVVAASGPLAAYRDGHRLFACRDGAPVRRQAISDRPDCNDEYCAADAVVALTGSCVAVRSDVEDRYYGDSSGLTLYDVRRRRSWRFQLKLQEGLGPPLGPDVRTSLASVVLGPGCALAYINSLGAGRESEVRTADARGRLLQARGTDIDPASLRRSGTTITWTQAGATRGARLAGAPRWRHPG
jgi:hypothetical protein